MKNMKCKLCGFSNFSGVISDCAGLDDLDLACLEHLAMDHPQELEALFVNNFEGWSWS